MIFIKFWISATQICEKFLSLYMYINDGLIFFFSLGSEFLKYLQSDPWKRVSTTKIKICFSTHKSSYNTKIVYSSNSYIHVLPIDIVIQFKFRFYCKKPQIKFSKFNAFFIRHCIFMYLCTYLYHEITWQFFFNSGAYQIKARRFPSVSFWTQS